MRRVDEETRRIVMKNRLDALEGDRLFDEINYGVEEFEAEDVRNPDVQEEWSEDDQ